MSAAPRLLALVMVCALPSSGAWAEDGGRDPSSSRQQDAACPGKAFRGTGAKARRQACLENHRRAVESRAEAERLRQDLRERCAQDPRSCEASEAQLALRLRDRGREQHAEGYSRD